MGKEEEIIMNIGSFIVPLGILTYTMAATTLLSGLLRAKLRNHKLLAYITIALATLHGGLVIYLKFF
jgi:hypothetical protein